MNSTLKTALGVIWGFLIIFVTIGLIIAAGMLVIAAIIAWQQHLSL